MNTIQTTKKHAKACFFFWHQKVRLTGIAIVAATKCIAWAITGTAWGTVAAAILVLTAEAALLAARLSGTLVASLPAKTLTTANTQSMTLSGVAIGLAVPLTVAFFAFGMAMTCLLYTSDAADDLT